MASAETQVPPGASTEVAGQAAGDAAHLLETPAPRVLTIDVGGTKIKFLATGEIEPRKIPSGPTMNPLRMVAEVQEATKDWGYDVISIGFAGSVGDHGPRSEPGNLAPGWVGFDFAAA
ncbi:MAG TPA: hypothetical protein VG713_06095, partial [Pirellulales bacterium]|nr:hypothetical protein [Pirellulales bacterium]